MVVFQGDIILGLEIKLKSIEIICTVINLKVIVEIVASAVH